LVVGCPGAVFDVLSSKVMDLYRNPEADELMRHEAAMYEHLFDLQDDCIPKFRGVGCNPLYAFMSTLTVKNRGVPVSQLEGGIREEECDLVEAAFGKMHERGVLYRRTDFGACVRVLRSKKKETRVHLTDLSEARLVEEGGNECEDKQADLELFKEWRRGVFLMWESSVLFCFCRREEVVPSETRSCVSIDPIPIRTGAV
jgi:hypothetical protein